MSRSILFRSSICGISIFLFLACGSFVDPNPSALFKEVFGEQPPPGVGGIDADISCGQDCTIWLQFESTQDFSSFLIDRGFSKTTCSRRVNFFRPTELRKDFVPPWVPDLGPRARCDEKWSSGDSRDWLVVVKKDLTSGLTQVVSISFPPRSSMQDVGE